MAFVRNRPRQLIASGTQVRSELGAGGSYRKAGSHLIGSRSGEAREVPPLGKNSGSATGNFLLQSTRPRP